MFAVRNLPGRQIPKRAPFWNLLSIHREKMSCETAVTHFSIIVPHAEREKSQKENLILDVLCTEGHSFFYVKHYTRALTSN